MINIQKLKPQYIIDEEGKKTSVIISLADFIELIEDIEDLAIAAERKEDASISHEELVKELREKGFV